MVSPEELCRTYYAAFNARRLTDAAAFFAADARVQLLGVQVLRGPEGYLTLARAWLEAFPDATATVTQIRQQSAGLWEAELSVSGTHRGTLQFGPWIFRATELPVTFSMRELLHVEDGCLRGSTLSLDSQDLVRQLVKVDVVRVVERLDRIRQLGAQLAECAADVAKQRELLERLGAELDMARHLVRPYFR